MSGDLSLFSSLLGFTFIYVYIDILFHISFLPKPPFYSGILAGASALIPILSYILCFSRMLFFYYISGVGD